MYQFEIDWLSYIEMELWEISTPHGRFEDSYVCGIQIRNDLGNVMQEIYRLQCPLLLTEFPPIHNILLPYNAIFSKGSRRGITVVML